MVLIVDDHPEICRGLAKLLELRGVEAKCVNDPAAAVRLVESLKPDLLVLDQMMPGLNGTDVLKAIRSIPALAAIPTVFYSASTEGQEEARRLGALEWLVKGQTDWLDILTRIAEIYHACSEWRRPSIQPIDPADPIA